MSTICFFGGFLCTVLFLIQIKLASIASDICCVPQLELLLVRVWCSTRMVSSCRTPRMDWFKQVQSGAQLLGELWGSNECQRAVVIITVPFVCLINPCLAEPLREKLQKKDWATNLPNRQCTEWTWFALLQEPESLSDNQDNLSS